MEAIDSRLTPVPATRLEPFATANSEQEREAAPSAPTAPRIAGVDEAILSPEGLAALARSLQPEESTGSGIGGLAPQGAEAGAGQAGPGTSSAQGAPSAGTRSGTGSGAGATTLTPEEREVVRELSARDREVRAHEQAHKAAAGDLATSGPTYTYQRGPDGVNYAVGGEVGISLAEGRTPEETVQRAQRIQRAALAPAEPSPQDRAVAAQAAQMATRARAEVQAQKQAERDEENGEGAPSPSARRAAVDAYRAVAGEFEPTRATEPGSPSPSSDSSS